MALDINMSLLSPSEKIKAHHFEAQLKSLKESFSNPENISVLGGLSGVLNLGVSRLSGFRESKYCKDSSLMSSIIVRFFTYKKISIDNGDYIRHVIQFCNLYFEDTNFKAVMFADFVKIVPSEICQIKTQSPQLQLIYLSLRLLLDSSSTLSNNYNQALIKGNTSEDNLDNQPFYIDIKTKCIYIRKKFYKMKRSIELIDCISLAKNDIKQLNDSKKASTGHQVAFILHTYGLYHALDVKAVAGLFNLSTRTFQRKLSAEGLSFSLLQSQAKDRTTIDLLERNIYSISDISEILRYSSIPAFYKAFISWHKMTPKQYLRNKIISYQ